MLLWETRLDYTLSGKQLSLIIPRTGDHSDFGPRGQMPQAQVRPGRFTASLVLNGICAPIKWAPDRVCRFNPLYWQFAPGTQSTPDWRAPLVLPVPLSRTTGPRLLGSHLTPGG